MPPPPPTQPPILQTAWSKSPGPVVHIVATNARAYFAEAPTTGDPLKVRVGSWDSAGWSWEAAWTVPRPPGVPVDHDFSGTSAWLAVDSTRAGARVAINRVEYQGGSHGISLASFAGSWEVPTEIDSSTDSDIGNALTASSPSPEVSRYPVPPIN